MSRFMRMMVFFDLPVMTKKERRQAAKFRQNLIREGFSMLQYSVYYRICNGYDMVEKYERRLNDFLPEKGSVRLMVITEKQFESMRILVGDPTINEEKIKGNPLSLF